MNALLKNIGVIIVLIGAAVLLLYHFATAQSNLYLWIGLALEVIGLIVHIAINKSTK